MHDVDDGDDVALGPLPIQREDSSQESAEADEPDECRSQEQHRDCIRIATHTVVPRPTLPMSG